MREDLYMRLDSLNRWLGVKTPAEVFKSCPGCKNAELLEFEGEVFCDRCSWDSVLIHAEVLAEAQLLKQRKRAKPGTVIVTPKRESLAYRAWFATDQKSEGLRGHSDGIAHG
jgi:hypothetical protein